TGPRPPDAVRQAAGAGDRCRRGIGSLGTAVDRGRQRIRGTLGVGVGGKSRHIGGGSMSIVGLALLLALCIPIIAILLDSPVGRALARRLESTPVPQPEPTPAIAELERRMLLLEGDVEILQQTITELQDENQFLQRLLEEKRDPPSLPADGM